MKTILIAAALVMLTGCATSTTTSTATTNDAAAEMRESAINARAMEHQKRGVSARDARALAESEYDESLVAQRRAEPAARTTPR